MLKKLGWILLFFVLYFSAMLFDVSSLRNAQKVLREVPVGTHFKSLPFNEIRDPKRIYCEKSSVRFTSFSDFIERYEGVKAECADVNFFFGGYVIPKGKIVMLRFDANGNVAQN